MTNLQKIKIPATFFFLFNNLADIDCIGHRPSQLSAISVGNEKNIFKLLGLVE